MSLVCLNRLASSLSIASERASFIASFGLFPITWICDLLGIVMGAFYTKITSKDYQNHCWADLDQYACHSSIGRCFLNIFFWINLILGRLIYYLKYIHVAYQLEALVIMEHLANSFCSWRLPFQHWDRRSQCLLFYQRDSWTNHILPEYGHVVHQIEALDMTN